MTIKATFKFERETKGTLFFREADNEGIPLKNFKEGKIGSIYLRKEALDGESPDTINVTVDW
jgi:hypothetical protein